MLFDCSVLLLQEVGAVRSQPWVPMPASCLIPQGPFLEEFIKNFYAVTGIASLWGKYSPIKKTSCAVDGREGEEV